MPPRNRACQTCRQKRRKCDFTLPECQQCLRANQICPGPHKGPIFINQTQVVTNKYAVKACWSTKKCLPKQVSSELIVSEAFVGHFVLSCTSFGTGLTTISWLSALNKLPEQSGTPAFSLALRATALAYCAQAEQNWSATAKARSDYGRALVLHAKTIAQNPDLSMLSMLGTSIIMSFFEAVSTTTSQAYEEHLGAARKLLAAAREQEQYNAILDGIELHIQYQIAFRLIVGYTLCEQTTSKRTSEYVLQIDPLANLLVDLSKIYARKFHNIASVVESIEVGFMSKVVTICKDLEANLFAKVTTLPWEKDTELEYDDAIAAITLASLNSLRMLVLLVSNTNLGGEVRESLKARGATILQAATYLARHEIRCAWLRMYLPLTLVAMHSPVSAQQAQADTLLRDWLGKTPLAGLSLAATERVRMFRAMCSGYK
ncbi:hypothetical protein, variant [Cladophialophora immunda]|uniref:Zn(2)-C6 fungal-type domain-containing protein n=1 Tax=Cladophialophora immunda TaxID=569365 RepID=A0A0D2CVY6_9EURO|nr:uncharacterized protein PV07_00796 [Cladophialophora immunda]XP_016254207.1 hypothetical protein, variant [Cladophialophora immunda]KIW33990.1 hypothetical protein PV07_00796 [Cladophialophora immunda]KIW33991.1 hypothetical protein, variant [Cladophialophora immunda]